MGIYPNWALGEKRTQGTAISALGVGGRGGGSTWETTVAWRGEAARVLDSGSSGLLCAPQTHPFIPPPHVIVHHTGPCRLTRLPLGESWKVLLIHQTCN